MDTPNDLTITCADGIKPRILSLEQHSTYRGLLDGGPTHELNEQILEGVSRSMDRIPTHLVRPAERPLEPARHSPRGPIVVLPERQCTGLFDAGGHWLTIVWFQYAWAPPIDPMVLEELGQLDFLANAFDEVGSW
jgi:hypothetical protein